MVPALRAAVDAYKKAKREQKEKSRLLNRDLDYLYFQKLLNSLADDQNKLMIVIKLASGAVIEIKRQVRTSGSGRDPYVEVLE